jgi:hypothetical protein
MPHEQLTATLPAVRCTESERADIEARAAEAGLGLAEYIRSVLFPARRRGMRDANHYIRLLDENPNAQVGFTLAASAVYAARYGSCEAADHGTDEWCYIARDLKARYGDNLNASDVRSEMGKSSGTLRWVSAKELHHDS